jgi:hypothetical protein
VPNRVGFYPWTETESSLRNVIFNKINWMMDNVQKVNYCRLNYFSHAPCIRLSNSTTNMYNVWGCLPSPMYNEWDCLRLPCVTQSLFPSPICMYGSVSVSYVRCVRLGISYARSMRLSASRMYNEWDCQWQPLTFAMHRTDESNGQYMILLISHRHTGRDYIFLTYNVRDWILQTVFPLITM